MVNNLNLCDKAINSETRGRKVPPRYVSNLAALIETGKAVEPVVQDSEIHRAWVLYLRRLAIKKLLVAEYEKHPNRNNRARTRQFHAASHAFNVVWCKAAPQLGGC